jgi:hypothetical protein
VLTGPATPVEISVGAAAPAPAQAKVTRAHSIRASLRAQKAGAPAAAKLAPASTRRAPASPRRNAKLDPDGTVDPY